MNSFKASYTKNVYDMTIKLMKEVIHLIASLLDSLYNSCLTEGIFPYALKISKTAPIFKKCLANEIASYRPISVIIVRCLDVLYAIYYRYKPSSALEGKNQLCLEP